MHGDTKNKSQIAISVLSDTRVSMHLHNFTTYQVYVDLFYNALFFHKLWNILCGGKKGSRSPRPFVLVALWVGRSKYV